MKNLYMRRWVLVLLMIGLGVSQLWSAANSTSTDPETGVVTYVYDAGNNINVANKQTLEIKGNLLTYGNIEVNNGGVLVVYGDLISYGNSIVSNGRIIVQGDLISTSQTAIIQNNGDLVVGGDVNVADLKTQGNNGLRIFFLNPDADIVGVPGTTPYGGYDELPVAGLPDRLISIIDNVIKPIAIGYQWKTDVSSSDWRLPVNWSGNKVPTSETSARIKQPGAGFLNPQINPGDIIVVQNLTVESGATLTLKPGARLTVNGKLTIADGASLIMEHEYGEGGMSSLITNGKVVGQVTTRMTLPQNQWFYLGSSRKNAIFSDFGAGNDGISISVFRSNKYWPIKSTLAGNALRTMEGIATNFLPSESDKDGDGQADSRLIEYKGEINTDVVSRTFDIAGFHLLANPFTSFIDWQDGAGWERANVDHTIWYRTKIGEEMTFVTYNNCVDEMARIAISPYSLEEITPEIVEEHSKIAPMQAVWIKTLSPNASVNLYPESRNHGTAISRLKSSSESGNVIRIEAENKFSRDGAVIFFKDGFTEGKDNGDSEKYFNDSKNIPEVYTIASGKPLAISGLPELSEDYRAIPLSVKNRIEGSVTLKFDLRYFNNEYTAYLEDRYTGTYINLLQNNSYTYSVVTLGEVHDRFVVHLHKITTGIEEVLPEQGQTDGSDFIKIRSLGDKVLVSVSAELIQNGPGVIEVYSIDGRKISEIPAASSRTFLILPQEKGVYIVRAIFGKHIKSERVINSQR